MQSLVEDERQDDGNDRDGELGDLAEDLEPERGRGDEDDAAQDDEGRQVGR